MLNVALTKRNHVPMCGIPLSRGGQLHPAPDQGRQTRRHLRSGQRAAAGKDRPARDHAHRQPRHGRAICRCSTRSETTSSRAICAGAKGDGFGFAFVDLTTGDFRLTELADDKELADELARVQPAEVLVSEEQAARFPRAARARRARWLHLPARPGVLHAARAFQSAVARRLRLRRRCPRRSAPRARSCTTSRTNCGARSSHSRGCTVYRNSQFMIARCRDAGESRTRASARRRTRHLAARRARSHRHADGRAQVARLDSASALRPRRRCARASRFDRRSARPSRSCSAISARR